MDRGALRHRTGSTVTGTGLTITTHGNYDSENNFGAAGVTNQSYGEMSGGGVVTLTGSSILTTGTQATGVYTANGGATTLTNDTVTTDGDGSTGLIVSGAGSKLNASGVIVTTLGSGTLSVDQHGVVTNGRNDEHSRADRSPHRARVPRES